jgi:hypothetical protein
MGHLVEERVGEHGLVPFQEEVDVQGDLQNQAPALPVGARAHVAQGRPHAAAEPEWKVGGESVAEASSVVERVRLPEPRALLGGARAPDRRPRHVPVRAAPPHRLQVL